MDRSEAMQALVRAGRSEEIQTAVDRWARKAQAGCERARSDQTRTEGYKRWQMAVAVNDANRALTEELVKLAGSARSDDRDDAGHVFGVRGVSGDAASLVISRRDAGDRVAGITSEEELQTLLARATRNGDEVLARAVAERAMELRSSRTLQKFTHDRPHLSDAVDRLWSADQANSDMWALNVQLMALRPTEFDGLPFASIEHIAVQGEPVAP